MVRLSLPPFIVSVATVVQGAAAEYILGDIVDGYFWEDVDFPLGPQGGVTGLNNAQECKDECQNFSGGSYACNVWTWWKPNNRKKCFLGHIPFPAGDEYDLFSNPPNGYLKANSKFQSGIIRSVCDDLVGGTCSQGNACSGYSDATTTDVYGVERTEAVVSSGGTNRCYLSYVPTECQSVGDNCPIYFFFGGPFDDAEYIASDRSDLIDLVTGVSASTITGQSWANPGIIIFPQKFTGPRERTWNFHQGLGDLCTTFDDVQFTKDILSDITSNGYGYYDSSKISLVGHSAGGMHIQDNVEDLRAEGVTTAKMAVHAAPMMRDFGGTGPTQGQPMEMMFIHGYNDAIHAYNGRESRGCYMGLANVRDNADWWGDEMGCSGYTVDQTHSGGYEKHRSYNGCDSGASVELWSLFVSHSWTPLIDQYVALFLEF